MVQANAIDSISFTTKPSGVVGDSCWQSILCDPSEIELLEALSSWHQSAR